MNVGISGVPQNPCSGEDGVDMLGSGEGPFPNHEKSDNSILGLTSIFSIEKFNLGPCFSAE